MIGQTISHYKITEKIGEGGMGVVYRAEDLKLGRRVAMKFLPPHLGTDEEKKMRFIQEAKTASLIEHPNIGTIYDIDETSDGYLYIVMPFYEGETLKHRIERGPLSIEDATDIALQIARGMVKAHERGIIHRDLKPGNILITNDGIIKIIDFGLAKLTGGIHLTKSNTALGTIAYMSPEQTRADEFDQRSDIWSLGIILFEMITGKLPFRGEFETALMYSIANENPLPIETFRSSIPFELKLIIARILQKEPSERYQSMEEVIADMKLLQKSDSEITGVSDWQTATRAIHYIIKKQSRKFFWMIIIGMLLISAGIVYLLWPSESERDLTSKSIAVLPISNLGEAEQRYYAEGFTDDLASGLSDLPNLLVIAKKSTSLLKDTDLNDSAIVAKLGAKYLLKGQLQPLVARIKYNVWLIDGETDDTIWTGRYDISRGDILTVKNTILRTVAEHLGISTETIKTSRYQTQPDVYESYLHGLYFRDKNNRDDNILAITYFSEAIRKDSNFLPALVSLANAQIEHFRQGWDYSEKYLSDAMYFCQKALEIDTNNSSALAERGIVADLKGKTEEGLQYLLKSFDKDRNNATALTSIAWIYLFKLNQPAKGVMYLKQLQDIDPLDWLTSLNLGVAYGQIKNYPAAVNSFQRAHRLNPEHEWPPYSLGYVYERIGQLDSAVSYYNAALKINPMNPQIYEALTSVLNIMNRIALAESIMTSGLQYLQNDCQMLYCMGVTYTLNKKYADAQKIFSQGSRLLDLKIKENPGIGDHFAYSGLFNARLGKKESVYRSLQNAVKLDSTNEDLIMKVARAYAVLGEKENMLIWFGRAKQMNPEYDAAYLRTAMDFEKYRADPDLLLLARQ